MRISVVGEKGGTGKSTIATNIAALMAAEGKDVMLIDADPQQSAASWQSIRSENQELPQVSCVSLFGASMAKEALSLGTRYQNLVIDTGGRDSAEMRSALVVSDLAILPFKASMFDILTIRKMHEIITMAAALNPQLKVLALINQAETNHTNTDFKEAQEAIAEFPGICIASRPIKSRISFKRASSLGRSVVEFEANAEAKATMEMLSLYRDMLSACESEHP